MTNLDLASVNCDFRHYKVNVVAYHTSAHLKIFSNYHSQVFFCVLSVAALGSIEALTVNSNDVVADLIERNLPAMVKDAQGMDASITDRYMKVDLAFYPLVRSLVYLQSALGQIDDAPRRIQDINDAERIDVRMFKSGP